jgi:DNA (cytosine-5)-methyltransferase 1
LENVPGLARDERLELLVSQLEALGYPARCGFRILDAADYGVPQHRRRLVILAGKGTVVPFSPPSSARATVRDAIAGLPAAGRSGDALHDLPERRSPAVRALIRRIPKDGGSRLDLGAASQLPCHRRLNGFKDVYGRMAWNKPAPTITGGCHNPSKGRFLHPHDDRAITLREAALLQGFPTDYRFSLRRGKLATAAMIGNALPPLFVEVQARQLAIHLAAPLPGESV